MELPSGSGDAPVVVPECFLPFFMPFERPEPGRKRGSKWVYNLAQGPCGECSECTRRLGRGMVLRSKACLNPRERATEGCRDRPLPKAKAKAKAKAKSKAKPSSSSSTRPYVVYIHIINSVVLDS